ncbi:MAG: hypothetical protein ACOYB1_13605 [Limnohabitans sp.]
MKTWFFCLLACLISPAHAQATDDVPDAIAKERLVLSAKRSAVLAEFETRSQACWQKFAVNTCLMQARRIRRADMEPIRQAELALNEQERQWRTQQRNERLQNKQGEGAAKP